MVRSKPCKSRPNTLAMFAVAAIVWPSLATAEDCSIVSVGKRIVAQEGGKFLDPLFVADRVLLRRCFEVEARGQLCEDVARNGVDRRNARVGR